MMTAILLCGLTTLLISCGDDDDTPKPSVKTYVSCTITMKVNAAVINGLPVVVGYYDESGNIKQVEVSTDSWEKTVTYDLSKTNNVGCLAARKIVNTENLDDDANYNVGVELSIPANFKFSDGSETDFNLTVVGGYTNKITGEGIKVMQSRGKNHINYTYSTYKIDGSSYATSDSQPIVDALGLKTGNVE